MLLVVLVGALISGATALAMRSYLYSRLDTQVEQAQLRAVEAYERGPGGVTPPLGNDDHHGHGPDGEGGGAGPRTYETQPARATEP